MDFSTEIYISKKAIANNIKYLKELIGDNIRISSVVKSNAYGHGIEQYVPIAEENGIDHFAVFSYWEAMKVYNVVKKSTDIMIMGWIDNSSLKDAIEKDIEFFVFNMERLEAAGEAAKELGIPAKIHIELETGMNRTGFEQRAIPKLVKYLNDNREHFIIKGICSHLAGPESIANHVRVKNQIKNFKRKLKHLQSKGIDSEYKHLACSAASVCYHESRFNMVRIGIMQYGFWSSKEIFLRHISKNKEPIEDPLRRVISWRSEVMSIKHVKTGEFISYGTTYLAQEDMKIAVVPIGYSNGYSRLLSNHGRIIINGVRCQVIGLVNMNMIIVNVTLLDNVKVGDEAVLIGTQHDITISVDSFSEISQQINYEILSRLPLNIPRIVIE